MDNQPSFERMPSMVRRAALALAITVGAAACSEGDTTKVDYDPAATTMAPADQETLNSVKEACGVELDMDANAANRGYTKEEAVFPTLRTRNEEGESVLLPVEDVSKRLKRLVATDARALALTYGVFLSPREERQLPGVQTTGTIEDLINTYDRSEEAAANAAVDVCAALNASLLRPTETFAVTTGQAWEYQVVRDESGKITGIQSVSIPTTGNLSGYKLGFDAEAALTEEERAFLEKLQELAIITGDGTIVINQLIGEGGIDLSEEQEPVPASVVEDDTSTTVDATPEEDEDTATTSNNQNTGQTNQGTGSNSGTGTTVANQPGQTPTGTTVATNNTGNAPSGGNNNGNQGSTGQAPSNGGSGQPNGVDNGCTGEGDGCSGPDNGSGGNGGDGGEGTPTNPTTPATAETTPQTTVKPPQTTVVVTSVPPTLPPITVVTTVPPQTSVPGNKGSEPKVTLQDDF